MDEILGENPFAMPGESSLMAEVLEAGEWESEDPFRHEAAEARLEEWESELGEQPWSGEQERGSTRFGRPNGRGRAPAFPRPALPSGMGGGPVATGPGQSPGLTTRLATDATACPDVTFLNQPWNRGKPGRHQTAEGTASLAKVAEAAAVRKVELGDFDVDDYRLRPAHRAQLGVLVEGIAKGLSAGKIVAPVSISVQGRTSSSGSMSHNLALSRHRSVNTLNMISCLARQAGIAAQLELRWTPVGESVSQTTTGDNREDADQRQVRVLIIAPRPVGFQPTSQQPGVSTQGRSPMAGPGGGTPYRPGSPAIRPSLGGGRRVGSRTAQLCFEVLSVKPSRGFAWLRTGGVSTVSARIRVHDHRTRREAFYVLQGIVLRASTPTSPGLLGRLGPLARLAGIAHRILGIASRARIPSRTCSPTSAIARGGSAIRLLGGPAVLAIPPAGSGRAAMHLTPRSPLVRLSRRLVPIRARRLPTPVMIVGRLRLAPQGVRWGVGQLHSRELGENEFGEFGELSEYNELNEYGEAGYGEYGEAGYGELNEYGESELGESELGESEGLGELTEYGEFAELNEYGELSESESEFSESELGEYEFEGESEYESELGELNEYGEWGESESELGEFEGLGELTESGEFSELGG
jgi:outer membrane protein OmpA-like peptidoglycan-associated protein